MLQQPANHRATHCSRASHTPCSYNGNCLRPNRCGRNSIKSTLNAAISATEPSNSSNGSGPRQAGLVGGPQQSSSGGNGKEEPSGVKNYPKALQNGTLAFGFSAGGLLFPYYLGVADQLQQLGVLQPDAHLSGASAGSLIAACLKSGLPLSTIQAACFDLARDCRNKGTRHRLKFVLQDTLQQLLPADVAERCNGQVHVAVTRLTPGLRPQLVSHFRDREDLIAALLTSCHIPWYFDGNLVTSFRKEPCFDGGITNFLPDVPNATTCRVCCLPSKQLGRIGNIAISPDSYQDWPYSLQQMLGWAFEPADEEQLLMLIECGRNDAQQWAHAVGFVPESGHKSDLMADGSGISDAVSSGEGNGNGNSSAVSGLGLPTGVTFGDNKMQ